MRLRFSLFFTLAALIAAPSALAQSAFLNEFHYDNDGGDTGEFVEIAVADGILDVEDVVITLYNGSGGASYNTVSGADLTVGASQNGYTLYTYSFPSNGIQNGSPDGIALSTTEGDVLQFLSYEGSFTATNGPANGETSDDIGVSEAGDTPVGFSLQLTGTSATYDGFTWASPMAATLGAVNTGQTFESPAPPDPDPVEVSFADETRMVREGDTLTVALELDYNENEPSGPVTVLVSFVGGASSATTADFASASVASATFPGQRARDNMAEVTFVFADDDLVEGPETATFRLAVTSGDAVTGSPNILTVTVDDAPHVLGAGGALVAQRRHQRLGLLLGDGDQQPAGGLGVEGEGDNLLGDRLIDGDRIREVLAISPRPAADDAGASQFESADRQRQRHRRQLEDDAARLGDFGGVSEETEAGDVGDGVGADRLHRPGGTGVEGGHRLDRSGGDIGARLAIADGGRDCTHSEGLGQDEAVPRSSPAVGDEGGSGTHG